MLATVNSAALLGIQALPVAVEVDIGGGIPGISIVGLPDSTVRESKDRVRAALRNSGFEIPPRRITVNLSPAPLRKEGSAYDLPVALAILAALGRLEPNPLGELLVVGELSLDGRVNAIRGGLPIARYVEQASLGGLLLPGKNAPEAALVNGVVVYPVQSLGEAVAFLTGQAAIEPARPPAPPAIVHSSECDFSDVRGQQQVRRALEVAAAGAHNILLIGPPGAGKTMLARRLPSILPAMTPQEALQTTTIYSVCGKLNGGALLQTRPFRAPHHSASTAAIVGGGTIPKPGEVSLAHNGVLFLDELPEFRRDVLEALRQPLEERSITVARASARLEFPASFMLVAAMNPCPCGYLGDTRRACTCNPQQIERYRARISGPVLDRIDVQIEVPAVPFSDLASKTPGEPSASIRGRVEGARQMQQRRCKYSGTFTNAEISARSLQRLTKMSPKATSLLERAMNRLSLSARAYTRILKVSRTIADLAGGGDIEPEHIAEAIQYRSLDRGDGAGA